MLVQASRQDRENHTGAGAVDQHRLVRGRTEAAWQLRRGRMQPQIHLAWLLARLLDTLQARLNVGAPARVLGPERRVLDAPCGCELQSVVLWALMLMVGAMAKL